MTTLLFRETAGMVEPGVPGVPLHSAPGYPHQIVPTNLEQIQHYSQKM